MDPSKTYVLEETITTKSKSLEELAEIAAEKIKDSGSERDTGNGLDELDFDVLK